MFKYKIEADILEKPVIMEAESSIEAVSVFLRFAKAFKEGMHGTRDEVKDKEGNVTFMRIIYDCCEDSDIDPRCEVYRLTRI